MLVTFLLIITAFPTFGHGQTNGTCHDAFSCALAPLVFGETDIFCYGSHSCFESPQISTIGSATIYCYGAYSCYNADILQHVDWFGNIHCEGLSACANINYFLNEYGNIQC